MDRFSSLNLSLNAYLHYADDCGSVISAEESYKKYSISVFLQGFSAVALPGYSELDENTRVDLLEKAVAAASMIREYNGAIAYLLMCFSDLDVKAPSRDNYNIRFPGLIKSGQPKNPEFHSWLESRRSLVTKGIIRDSMANSSFHPYDDLIRTMEFADDHIKFQIGVLRVAGFYNSQQQPVDDISEDPNFSGSEILFAINKAVFQDLSSELNVSAMEFLKSFNDVMSRQNSISNLKQARFDLGGEQSNLDRKRE